MRHGPGFPRVGPKGGWRVLRWLWCCFLLSPFPCSGVANRIPTEGGGSLRKALTPRPTTFLSISRMGGAMPTGLLRQLGGIGGGVG